MSVLASNVAEIFLVNFLCSVLPNMKLELQIIHIKFTRFCINEDSRYAFSLILVMCIYIWYWPLSPLFTIESAA